MKGIGQELRQAARRLTRSPAFSLASLSTLALAIGANVAIFAVVQRVVLNPLPYPDSGSLLKLEHRVPRVSAPSVDSIPLGLYYVYVDRARSLEAIAAYRPDEVTLTGDGDPERIQATRATPSMASVLGVSPARGRWFTEQESVPGAPQVAVLSHGLWIRRYGGADVLGRSVVLSGVSTQIVGVMPASYAFPDSRVDVWIADQVTRTSGFGIFTHIGIARLRAGATIAGARAELDALIADLPHVYPGSPLAVSLAEEKMRSVAVALKEATVGGVERALWTLFASAVLVMLVACANVANLILVRSEARRREVAIRRALGAGRREIARYFFGESAWLSIAGGAIGLALAWGAVRLLVVLGPASLPRLQEIRLDGVALTFTFALSVLAMLAFGVIPMFHRAPVAAALHEAGRGSTASRGRHRVRHILMAGQMALALILVVASGLMVRSFHELRTMDPGFDPTSVLTFGIGLPDREYPNRAVAVRAHQAILDEVSKLPGVKAVSASTCLPLEGCFGNTLLVEGRAEQERAAPRPVVTLRAVAGGYVEAMGMRLVRGRSLDRGDVDRNEPNVIINVALADAYFPNEDPVGRRVASSRPPTLPPPAWLTIVGVVSNTPSANLAERIPAPKLYMPMSIAGGPGIPVTDLVGPNVAAMSYVVRSTTPPLELMPSVRSVIDNIDANLPLADVGTLQGALDRASAQMAFTMILLAIGACVALMLGVIGVYGVMSYIVTQRTGEIGVRLALGAEPRSVARQIAQQGGIVALAGITVGLATALASSRLIESLLYGVTPRDPGVFAATTATLLVVAFFACWLPARRAARLDPLEALRSE